MQESAISVQGLNFDFGGPAILSDIHLELPRGSPNGAGKSTLLRVLSGKNLCKAQVKVLGSNPFFEGSIGITYLGVEWAHNPVVRSDVPVARLLKSLGAERHQERCSTLLDILDVNPDWKMHEVSDGQRRRVQIVLGLLEPWDLLLLDEVTVDLDVLVRGDLLRFLHKETVERGATILYATHIFDGLAQFPTHVAHMSNGKVDFVREAKSFPELDEARAFAIKNGLDNSPLLSVVEQWLRKDAVRESDETKPGFKASRWDLLSENMKLYGDRFYNYWR